MAVVGNHGGSTVLEEVEATRRVVAVVGERLQAIADGAPVQTQRPGCSHRGHHVVHLETDGAAQGDRNFREGDAVLNVAFGSDHTSVFHVHHGLPLRPVCRHDGVKLVGSKEDDRALALACHGRHVGVNCIEHSRTFGRYVLHDHALEHRQFIHGGDVVQAQMVATADVGDHCHIAAVKSQSFAQHAAAGGFQHGCVHVWVQQHAACTLGTAAVASVDHGSADIDTIGIGHADTHAVVGQQVRNQTDRGGFAIGASDGHDRNTTVLARFEHAGNDGLAHSAAFAKRGCQMHAQAGCGVDFHHAAALFFQWAQDGVAHHVHTADIQPYHARCGHGTRGYIGVHIVGDIGGRAAGGQVGVVAQIDALSLDGNRVGFKSLRSEAGSCNVVKTDFGEGRGVPATTAGVLVDLLHQLRDGVHAITHDLGRVTSGRRNQLVAHHQQTKIVAWHIALYQDVIAEFAGGGVGLQQLLFVADIDGDAFALVSVVGFDHDR